MIENQVFHHYFINNSIGAMMRGIADYFGTDFFDRTREIVIATYEKGVQHWIQRKNNAGEKMAPKFPYLVMDPAYDFEPDPQAGRFFWGYPNFMGQFATKLFKPEIYRDDNILIAPILNRYKGRFDLIVWSSSVYELMDFRTMTFQMFGGQDRIIQPVDIDGYIVMPDELTAYTYDNPFNGVSYSLDWSSSQAEVILVKNINQNKMVYPFRVSPWIRMLSCDDGSEKYGGSGDEVSDHRLNISCEWECSIPTHIGLIASKEPTLSTKPIDSFLRRDIRLSMDMDIGYEYLIPFDDPDTGEQESTSRIRSVIFQSFVGTNTADSTSPGEDVSWQETLSFKDKYSYTITQEDYDSIHADTPGNFIVNLIDDIEDPFKLRIYGRYGLMTRDYHWKINSPGEIEFIGTFLDNLKVGDNIWFAVYETMET